ncbi:hypothetical protein QA860_12005 [Streptomyces stelliscabiei]|uniref:hypothetical protein n=1 Tax=Streptomyces TaxID=1883 RepID=UPI000A5A627D|nr:hypothetical protein [Streptomyces sp. NRRL B-24085]
MTLAVVRSIGTPRRLETAQEYEDFEQELVDQFLLAGVGAGLSDDSIADDRRAIFEFVGFLGAPLYLHRRPTRHRRVPPAQLRTTPVPTSRRRRLTPLAMPAG